MIYQKQNIFNLLKSTIFVMKEMITDKLCLKIIQGFKINFQLFIQYKSCFFSHKFEMNK